MSNNADRFRTDAARWTAVVNRDATADGAFYYSVRTTGVYCVASCGSRQAKRENVRFHATCEDAQRAGFRACKRCRPNESARVDLVAKACRMIETADESPSLDALATAAGLSRFHFHRVFKKTTGLTPKDYAAAVRANRLRDELPNSKSVTSAFVRAGFHSNSRFYEKSGEMLGMTPNRFRNGDGATIRFAIGECSLGAILVAATDRGVCSIFLGDDPRVLVDDLQKRFAQATFVDGDEDFEQWVAKIVGFVESPCIGLDLPLDVRGTAFQERVWQALSAVRPGETVSYTELAKRIGAPKSVRAVAAACAANPLAVAIPCHRVVRKGGGLAGFRWGIARKRELLERESRL